MYLRTATIACFVLAAALARGKDRPPEPTSWYMPDPAGTVLPYQVVGRAVEVTRNGVRVRVEPLDDASRRTYFELRTNLGIDPFPTRSAYPHQPIVFAVSLENASAQELTFQPTLAQLMRDRDNEVLPVGADQVFAILRAGLASSDDPDTAATKGLELFHVHRLTLAPGERATRLLVFEAPPPGAPSLLLLLDQLTVGSEEVRLEFRFASLESVAKAARRPSRPTNGDK